MNRTNKTRILHGVRARLSTFFRLGPAAPRTKQPVTGSANLTILAASLFMLNPTGVAARENTAKDDAATGMRPLAPAQIDNALEIGGDDIEAQKVRTRMTVGVRINGQGPYRFVVDSGADTSVIGHNIAKTLRLPAGTPVTLHSMTASGQVERVLVDELGIGNSTVRDLQLPLLHERDLGGEGMVGIDALVEQRLMMDFERRVINIEDAKRPAPRLDGEIIVTARLQRGQLILTQAAANRRPVEAVIDTGSEITIGNRALRDKLIRTNAKSFQTIGATGVTGVKINLEIANVAELRLGPVVLQNVPVAFADAPPFGVFGLSKRPALLIGTDLMEKFRRVSLDFHARKVRFQLRKCDAITVRIGDAHLARISTRDGSNEACRR